MESEMVRVAMRLTLEIYKLNERTSRKHTKISQRRTLGSGIERIRVGELQRAGRLLRRGNS